LKRAVKLHHDIANRIRSLIECRGLAPGTKLPSEKKLAVLLSVSRPSLRVGLTVLHIDGDIDIRPGAGCYVKSHRELVGSAFASAGPMEMLRARITIECKVVSEATLKASAKDVVRLRQLVEDMRATRCVTMGQSLSRSFHHLLAQIAGSPSVGGIIALLMSEMSGKLRADLDACHLNYLRECEIAEHQVILEAISAGDPAAAANGMRSHLFCVEERLRCSYVRPAPLADVGIRKPAEIWQFNLGDSQNASRQAA
jgi:DNA-binding FadR family transcriptional regulator